jgi:CheY-like chemotaxis protein
MVASGSHRRPLRIFVVEDHADTLKWLELYLQHCGHIVFTARTMQEALSALPQAKVDVLISDIGLPDGDGWELLRSAHLSYPVYGIAISGFGMKTDLVKSIAAGYRAHLLKPFRMAELDRLLEEAAEELAL